MNATTCTPTRRRPARFEPRHFAYCLAHLSAGPARRLADRIPYRLLDVLEVLVGAAVLAALIAVWVLFAVVLFDDGGYSYQVMAGQ